MALNKQALTLSFAKGLDTKSDPKQVQFGKFLDLQNSVFDKTGLLQKRNGFGNLTELISDASYLTTFSGNLTAIGSSFQAYSAGSQSWVDKGYIQPAKISTLPLIRSNTNQTYADTAIAPNGFICTVFADNDGSATTYKYAVADSITGQNIVAPAALTVAGGAVTYTPKVFLLGRYFIIVFSANFSGTYSLQYVVVSTVNPGAPSTAATLAAGYQAVSTVAWDAVVSNSNLYFAWATSGGDVKVGYITSDLTITSPVTFATQPATHMSVTVDYTTAQPTVWVVYYDTGTTNLKALAVSPQLTTVRSPVTADTGVTVSNVTSAATGGICSILYELADTYGYDAGVPTHRVYTVNIPVSGSPSGGADSARSVGLASKAFLIGTDIYYVATYSSPYQPTYFLMTKAGKVVAKLAYQNGGGYLVTGLPNVTVTDTLVQFPYLIKDLIQAVNKSTNVSSGTQTAGIYSQTGINLASIDITSEDLSSAEIGGELHVAGGFLWGYDGYSAVEHGFFLYPDSVEVTTATGSGALIAQKYYYQATYEWADNQGNIFRSAPSIPVTITTTTGSSTNTVYVPTLRLTYKTANPVKIVLYRWSTAQQTYYQVTSISVPTLNSTSVNYVTITDALADATILGNNILYTTGGVLENIGEPALDALALYKSRLFFITSEDKNLLGYSKQVIENVPVEWNDALTLYIAPTTASQGNTGPMKAISAMDDKLVIFKKNAIYYLTGTGPDSTGANNDFSEPQFITSTVGCANPASIVFMPQGLMFQSDKGIWLLGRDLSTQFIGVDVDGYTQGATVTSAVNVPGTNQVRFVLDTGIVLMYDYYYAQWGTFVNIPSISSTLYQDLHTYINQYGQVRQETPSTYLDGTQPVLLSFTTSWLNVSGLRGYERAYFFNLVAEYFSPHKLNIEIAYDYAPSPSQSILVSPDNYNPNYGLEAGPYGSGSYGGTASLESWRVFFQQQKCKAFQITLSEVYDSTKGVVAGQGFNMSGLTLVIGAKKGYAPSSASRSAG